VLAPNAFPDASNEHSVEFDTPRGDGCSLIWRQPEHNQTGSDSTDVGPACLMLGPDRVGEEAT